jgi:two-component system chemotaxis response regulator CheB
LATHDAAEASSSPRPRSVVSLASSAGGINTHVLARLPRDLPSAVVVVVQHLEREHPSLLATILGRRSALPVTEAAHGDLLRNSHAFVAPPVGAASP